MSTTDDDREQDKSIDLAVALQYDGDNAPTVTAKGEQDDARRIVDIARAHEVPLYENALLAETLSQLELNQAIPASLYRSIAEIIAFSYWMRGMHPNDKKPNQ